MSEQLSENPSGNPSASNADIIALLKKMQQQMDFLERKIDNLINQSQEKSSGGEKRFDKPYRSFGPRQDKGEHGYSREKYSGNRENPPRDSRDSRGPKDFSKDSRDSRESFGNRKEYSKDRNSGEARPFEKRRDDSNQGFAQKKKPFYLNRKQRGAR